VRVIVCVLARCVHVYGATHNQMALHLISLLQSKRWWCHSYSAAEAGLSIEAGAQELPSVTLAKKKKNHASSTITSPHSSRKRSHFGTGYRKTFPPDSVLSIMCKVPTCRSTW